MREDEQLSYSFRMLLVFRDCISVSILVGRFSLVGPRTIHKHLDGKPERQRHRNPERIPLKELTSKKSRDALVSEFEGHQTPFTPRNGTFGVEFRALGFLPGVRVSGHRLEELKLTNLSKALRRKNGL